MPRQLKVIAVDDEFRALEILEKYGSKVPFIDWCGSFRNPIEAISLVKNEDIDLIFLDINMPELSGISFAKLLNENQQVIFTTAYSEYAIEGFALNVTDYLLKPIEYHRFLEACFRAKEKMDLRLGSKVASNSTLPEVPEFIHIKSGTILHQIGLEEIIFLEKLGNELLFHTTENVVSSRMNMKEIFDVIPESHFCRLHKSFIVAVNKLDKIEHHQVHIGQHRIPIGRSYKEAFLERISN